MRSQREVRSKRNNVLDELRAKHQQHFDAVDGVHWGCICPDGSDCLFIVILSELTKSQQEVIRVTADLKREYERHQEEIRKLTSELAGIETYNRRLERENHELRQGLDHEVPGPG